MISLKNLCLLTLVLSVVLIVLGPLIQFSPGQQLVCQDWPLCFGQTIGSFPQRGWIEISHRIIATAVGLLSFALYFISRRDKALSGDALLHKGLAYCVFFVLIQGLLGAMTVVYKLPMVISTLHMFFSLVYVFYMLKCYKLISIRFDIAEIKKYEEPYQSWWSPKIRDFLWISASLMFFTLLMGSFVRHTASLKICGTGWSALWSCATPWTPATAGQLQLHLFFRVIAFLSFAFSLVGLFCFTKNHLTDNWRSIFSPSNYFSNHFLHQAYLVAGLTLMQFLAGLMVIVGHVGLLSSIIYLALSLVCLLFMWSLAFDYSLLKETLKLENIHTLISDMFELTKPKLSALVMVTTLVGVILAPDQIGFLKSFISLFLIAMVVAGACALNCYIEMDIDAKMERTRSRALPAGRMRPQLALFFSAGLLSISIPLIFLYVNFVTGLLALIAAGLYLYAYTPLKQRSELALFVGAVPGALPPMMGWTTVTGSVDPMAWALFLILFVWQLPHFLAISVFNAKDYEHAGIRVYANSQSFTFIKNSIFIYTLVLLLTSILPSWWGGLGKNYLAAALVVSASFLMIAAKGLFLPENLPLRQIWAKRYFLASLFYLPFIMGAMIVFR